MQYKIIHIPASLHLPSNNPELDQMCPLDILLHVKRVRRSSVKDVMRLLVFSKFGEKKKGKRKAWEFDGGEIESFDGITGFSEEESRSIFKYMKVVIQLTKSHHHDEKCIRL
ncbi:uncharacterized protein [Elaeis guineensis]|uniref:uncharacterized protein isoform X1 n=1 Tax=Elaeis guineensis var. tenera TaxID=51953 RepID=UPI003C6D815F